MVHHEAEIVGSLDEHGDYVRANCDLAREAHLENQSSSKFQVKNPAASCIPHPFFSFPLPPLKNWGVWNTKGQKMPTSEITGSSFVWLP